MIAAFDVKYEDDGFAVVAAVVITEFAAAQVTATYTKRVGPVAAYQPGAFYRRELPCILSLLDEIIEPVATIIVDGYVYLGDKPGLGAHLRQALGRDVCVIGVAKSRFAGCPAVEVLRGASKKPLFVTASGMGAQQAADAIRAMHGEHRIPTQLKRVDTLSRTEMHQVEQAGPR